VTTDTALSAVTFREAQAGAASNQPPFETPVAEAAEGEGDLGTAALHTIGAAGGGQASVGSAGHEQLDLDHLDLDELSARIYGRLRRRLRAELLIDRERAGLLTDFR